MKKTYFTLNYLCDRLNYLTIRILVFFLIIPVPRNQKKKKKLKQTILINIKSIDIFYDFKYRNGHIILECKNRYST